ncbi:MAG: hypothetical protein PHX83_02260 [Acidobacteriia bacterium]|nr:hypothetical protein [Terriglobia bacterium]
MFSIVFNLILWIAAAWLLYPLVFIQFDIADIQTSFLRSTAGVVLLIIMFGKNMIDIMFQKMTKSEVHLRTTAMNVALTYTFIIVSVVSFAISVLLMIATRQQNNIPSSPIQ